MHSGVRVLALISLPLLLIFILPIGRLRGHRLHLKTCLQKADELREGAPVRISGVEVGIVRSVQVRPDDHLCPVMVEMELQTDYELRIPRDSKAYSSSAGIFGPAYVGIDSSDSSGLPIENWGTLPSKIVPEMTTEDSLRHLEAVVQRAQEKPAIQVPEQATKK